MQFVPHPVGDQPALRTELVAKVAPRDHVYLLDYSGKPGLIEDLCRIAGHVTLL